MKTNDENPQLFDEVVKLIHEIMRPTVSDEEASKLLDNLERIVPNPEASDIIFWSNDDLTVEEMAQQMFEYEMKVL